MSSGTSTARLPVLWDSIVNENPEQAEVSRVLAEWMNDYEVADAKAEAAFRKIAGEVVSPCPPPSGGYPSSTRKRQEGDRFLGGCVAWRPGGSAGVAGAVR